MCEKWCIPARPQTDWVVVAGGGYWCTGVVLVCILGLCTRGCALGLCTRGVYNGGAVYWGCAHRGCVPGLCLRGVLVCVLGGCALVCVPGLCTGMCTRAVY